MDGANGKRSRRDPRGKWVAGARWMTRKGNGNATDGARWLGKVGWGKEGARNGLTARKRLCRQHAGNTPRRREECTNERTHVRVRSKRRQICRRAFAAFPPELRARTCHSINLRTLQPEEGAAPTPPPPPPQSKNKASRVARMNAKLALGLARHATHLAHAMSPISTFRQRRTADKWCHT